nr:tyrosine-type recombinase/integrase [Streptomyces sp. SID3343]
MAAVKDKEPFPTIEEVTRRVRAGVALTERITVGQWLEQWIEGRRGLRPGSALRYASIIRVHLVPAIGHIRLDRLTIADIAAMFDAIRDGNNEIVESNILRRAAVDRLAATPWKGADNRALRRNLKLQIEAMPEFRRTTGNTSLHRIKATLRAALNAAIAAQKITFNPASHVELDPEEQPPALLWTPERVAAWRRTGVVPGRVMVWTPEQTQEFLDHVADHRLYALWHLVAHRGLRRGEACGQRWQDTDLDARTLTISIQLTEVGWKIVASSPKSKAGERPVVLDKATNKVLKAHRKRQRAEAEAFGDSWHDTGMIFTREDGSWLQPSSITKEFQRLVALYDLPPINMHGNRHGTGSRTVDQTGNLRTAQLLLGHAHVNTTTRYAAGTDEAARAAAELTAGLIRNGTKRKKDRQDKQSRPGRQGKRNRPKGHGD